MAVSNFQQVSDFFDELHKRVEKLEGKNAPASTPGALPSKHESLKDAIAARKKKAA